MNIYLVARTDECGYDEQCSVVVVAADEDAARVIAASGAGGDGPDRWFTPAATVKLLGAASPQFPLDFDQPVCRDFWAG